MGFAWCPQCAVTFGTEFRLEAMPCGSDDVCDQCEAGLEDGYFIASEPSMIYGLSTAQVWGAFFVGVIALLAGMMIATSVNCGIGV